MGDARAAGAPRVSQSAPSAMAREVKKLSWWQKLVLCTKVDDHKAAYQHYQAHQDLAHSQSVIAHHVSGASGAAPRKPQPPPTLSGIMIQELTISSWKGSCPVLIMLLRLLQRTPLLLPMAKMQATTTTLKTSMVVLGTPTDCLGALVSLLFPFWRFDAKGGEVVFREK